MTTQTINRNHLPIIVCGDMLGIVFGQRLYYDVTTV